LDLIHTL